MGPTTRSNVASSTRSVTASTRHRARMCGTRRRAFRAGPGPALALAVACLAAAPSVPGVQDARWEDDLDRSVAVTERLTVTASQPLRTGVLLGVTARHRDGEDRVVFRFRGPLPRARFEYVDQLHADGSGRRLRVAGRAILQVWFEPARAHTQRGVPTGAPRRRAFDLPNLMEAVRAGDFEGQVTYGLGLASRTPVRVVGQPRRHRVVVKVGADLPTVVRRVFLLYGPAFAVGREPYFVPVRRPVLAGSPATGVMDRLFAGPTPAERRVGLRLLRSGATGYTDLRISDGVARLRLRGRCSSGGSTATIAGEILPTLRQFDTVDWVKIHDPSGRTEVPDGPSDSIPACLEP